MSLALVTGASGFVGACLARALSDAGHRVRALEHARRAPFADERVRGGLESASARAAAVDGASVVYHAAALLDPVDSEREADLVNHVATLELARDARRAGARAFVFVSSQAAIGWSDGGAALLGEDAPCAPTTIYGRSKRAAELALAREDLAPMRVAMVRPPTVYGPGERRNFLALARAVATGVFPLLGRGDNRMSFCHVENLAAALLAIGEDERASGLLHASDARPVTLREVVDTIARAAGARRLPVSVPLPAARLVARCAELAFAPLGVRPPLDRARLTTLTSDRALDTSRLRALGFEPPVAWDEGVRETIASYRAEGVL